MTVEALLAIGRGGEDRVQPLSECSITRLEESIDRMQSEVPPITKFTLPGGDPILSMCHICRTVCRRAERETLRADRDYGIDPSAKRWLNRLSDYFYLLGRHLANKLGVDEIEWIP